MTRGHTRLLATQTDERLLELVQQGHERAFEAIVVRYRRPLLAYCRRLGLSDSRAEDALQQALLKAWLALQAGGEVRALRPWLYRTVHNTAVNVLRSSRDELPLEPDGALVELLAAPDSELESVGAARQALTHVAALPSMQRDAILMSAVDGRSHEEVARALGISSGSVRGLLYRARSTLRAAAAALTPAPLINWASGTAGRAAPTAGRLAELTGATGAADAGGVLLKGAAVAGSALLAAGVVLAPLHGRAAAGRPAPVSAPTNAGAEAPSAAAGHASPSASATASARIANGAPAGAPATRPGAPLSASVVTPATGHSGAPPATGPPAPGATGQAPPSSTSAAPTTATAATTTSSASTGSQLGGGEAAGGSAGGSGGGTGSGTGGGSSSGSETEGNHSESSSDDGAEGTDDGPGDDSGGSDSAEREREAASELAEREAEAARERTEREAEIAHEHEQHGGKDS